MTCRTFSILITQAYYRSLIHKLNTQTYYTILLQRLLHKLNNTQPYHTLSYYTLTYYTLSCYVKVQIARIKSFIFQALASRSFPEASAITPHCGN